MKKMFALFLVLVLALSLVACQDAATEDGGEESEEEAVSFAPQTAEEFFEAVLNDFNSRTEYRRRSESYPEKPEEGDILDLYVTNAGTEEQTLSGTLKEKETGAINSLYGEGNTLAKGPSLATQNLVQYVVTEESAVPLHLETLNVSLCLLPASMETTLFDGSIGEYLTDATLASAENGAFTLTVRLKEEDVLNLNDFESIVDEVDYGYPTEIVYTADKTGALSSLEYSLQRSEKRTIMIMRFSYGSETTEKPAWFNKENPLESGESFRASICYKLEKGLKSIYLSEDTEGLVLSVGAAQKSDDVVRIPDHFPTDFRFDSRNSNARCVIFSEWKPEMDFGRYTTTDVFFVKGARPEGETNKGLFFEGEWEMKNGIPTPIKKK
ncbi:MAG: hypothetical protein J6M34_06180 [Clostridia bacterium]|nr:hypothetical protein [Clostridia bacterium]